MASQQQRTKAIVCPVCMNWHHGGGVPWLGNMGECDQAALETLLAMLQQGKKGVLDELEAQLQIKMKWASDCMRAGASN
eukprot:5831894-Amphidinium_carterae.2